MGDWYGSNSNLVVGGGREGVKEGGGESGSSSGQWPLNNNWKACSRVEKPHNKGRKDNNSSMGVAAQKTANSEGGRLSSGVLEPSS